MMKKLDHSARQKRRAVQWTLHFTLTSLMQKNIFAIASANCSYKAGTLAPRTSYLESSSLWGNTSLANDDLCSQYKTSAWNCPPKRSECRNAPNELTLLKLILLQKVLETGQKKNRLCKLGTGGKKVCFETLCTTHRELIRPFYQIWVNPAKRLCYLTSKEIFTLGKRIAFSYSNDKANVKVTNIIAWNNRLE